MKNIKLFIPALIACMAVIVMFVFQGCSCSGTGVTGKTDVSAPVISPSPSPESTADERAPTSGSTPAVASSSTPGVKPVVSPDPVQSKGTTPSPPPTQDLIPTPSPSQDATPTPLPADYGKKIVIADKDLEGAIREQIGKPAGDILKMDVMNIVRLELNGVLIDSLSGIENLENLYYLHLENDGITDISPLESLKNLRDLDLWRNSITDLSPLAGLTKLESLEINDNYYSDLSPLRGLVNLKELYIVNSISSNRVTDISPLSGLLGLETLGLAYNNISDITPLSGLTGLRSLTLHHNSISDVRPLAGLKNLRTLYLGNNPIASFSPLEDIYGQLQNKDFTLDSQTVSPSPVPSPSLAPSPSPTPTPAPTPGPETPDASLPDLSISEISYTGSFQSYGDADIPLYQGLDSFTMTLSTGIYTWGSVAVDTGSLAGGEPLDLSGYRYAVIRARGSLGGEKFRFGLGVGPTEYYFKAGLSTEWQHIVFCLSPSARDLTDVCQIGFEIGGQWTGNPVGATISIGGITFSNNLPSSPYLLVDE